jgi:hypothetical protein
LKENDYEQRRSQVRVLPSALRKISICRKKAAKEKGRMKALVVAENYGSRKFGEKSSE